MLWFFCRSTDLVLLFLLKAFTFSKQNALIFVFFVGSPYYLLWRKKRSSFIRLGSFVFARCAIKSVEPLRYRNDDIIAYKLLFFKEQPWNPFEKTSLVRPPFFSLLIGLTSNFFIVL